MEAAWYADRANLRVNLHEHPTSAAAELAQRLGRSVNWVEKRHS